MTRGVNIHRKFGVLLDPAQFAAALASLKQRPQYKGRALYVALPDEVARLFESELVPLQQSIAISGGNALPVAAVTLQAAATQIVCLVPLATDEARAWLTEVFEAQRPILVAATIDSTSQLVLMQVPCPVRGAAANLQWDKAKRHLNVPRQPDPTSELADLLEVLQFVEQARESELPGIDVQEQWIFVCTPYQEPLEEAAGPSSMQAAGGQEFLH